MKAELLQYYRIENEIDASNFTHADQVPRRAYYVLVNRKWMSNPGVYPHILSAGALKHLYPRRCVASLCHGVFDTL